MQVINAVEYKQDGWNPAHYKRGMCGIGYSEWLLEQKGIMKNHILSGRYDAEMS